MGGGGQARAQRGAWILWLPLQRPFLDQRFSVYDTALGTLGDSSTSVISPQEQRNLFHTVLHIARPIQQRHPLSPRIATRAKEVNMRKALGIMPGR